MDLDHWTTIVVAIIGATGLVITGWFSYKTASRIKTRNGSNAGVLLDFIAEEMAWLRISHTEHVRDMELHRTAQQKIAKKLDEQQEEQ